MFGCIAFLPPSPPQSAGPEGTRTNQHKHKQHVCLLLVGLSLYSLLFLVSSLLLNGNQKDKTTDKHTTIKGELRGLKEWGSQNTHSLVKAMSGHRFSLFKSSICLEGAEGVPRNGGRKIHIVWSKPCRAVARAFRTSHIHIAF